MREPNRSSRIRTTGLVLVLEVEQIDFVLILRVLHVWFGLWIFVPTYEAKLKKYSCFSLYIFQNVSC